MSIIIITIIIITIILKIHCKKKKHFLHPKKESERVRKKVANLKFSHVFLEKANSQYAAKNKSTAKLENMNFSFFVCMTVFTRSTFLCAMQCRDAAEWMKWKVEKRIGAVAMKRA